MYHVVLLDEDGYMKDSEHVARLLDATMMAIAMSARLQVGWSIRIKNLGDI